MMTYIQVVDGVKHIRQDPPPPTAEELAAEDADAVEQAIAVSEAKSARLFFRLCKTLIDSGLVDPNDPNMAEIKAGYQEWNTLKGL